MLESTKRGLTEPCPRCDAPKGRVCHTPTGSRDIPGYIHAARRNLFFIDSGKKKTKRELHMSNVQEAQ